MDCPLDQRSSADACESGSSELRTKAGQGDAEAQYRLGVCCHRASVGPHRLGAVESRIEAYMWLCLAAAQGYGDSLLASQRLTITMTRAEVEDGNHRAAALVTCRPAL